MFCNKCGDPIEPNERFCNKCGNPLTSFQVSNEVADNKKMVLFGITIGCLIIIVLLLVLLVFKKKSSNYYFNISNVDDTEIIDTAEPTTKSNKYKTVIKTDNVYRNVNIENADDAYELIEKDSVSQKDNCPSSIRKIEDDIINKYGITAVNFCELDVDFATELGKVFQVIYEEYPEAKGYFTNLTMINASISDNYIAAFMPAFYFATSDTSSTYPWVIKTQMLLNSSYFLNLERIETATKASSNSGHFPKNSNRYSPVAHELGHYLSFIAMMKSYDMDSILLLDSSNIYTFNLLMANFKVGEFSLSMIEEAYENYKRDTNTTLSFDEWRGTISNYALAKDNNGDYIYDETIAESFHDVYLNGDKAADASKYVVAVLKERLGA